MTEVRPPMTPADCDLRDFPCMMVDIPRLFASEFDALANDSEWRFGFTLWLKSFHQVPAASLPDDDGQLARMCGLGRDIKTWRKSKAMALRGWVRCSDGMLYHEVVAEKALEGWLEKLTRRLSSGAGNAERWQIEFDPEPIRAEIGNAAKMLLAINPKSRWLSKQQVVLALKRSQRETPPALPPGSGGVPPGSQENGREGKLEEDSDESSLSARESKVWPEGLIPEGFPDADAIDQASGWRRQARAVLDVHAQAKRFRNHALAKKRSVANWPAAWRGWIDIEIEKAPKADAAEEAGSYTPAYTGPSDLRDAVVVAMGEGWTRSYLDPCKWRDVPTKTLVAPLAYTADHLRKGVDHILAERGISVVVEPQSRTAA